MEFKCPYWTNTTKIQLLQNWIIVHSILYYDYDTTLVDDRTYDMNARQLAKMMKKYPKSTRQTRYAYAFKDYDGSTGFDIPHRLTKNDRKRFRGIISFILKTEKENLK